MTPSGSSAHAARGTASLLPSASHSAGPACWRRRKGRHRATRPTRESSRVRRGRCGLAWLGCGGRMGLWREAVEVAASGATTWTLQARLWMTRTRRRQLVIRGSNNQDAFHYQTQTRTSEKQENKLRDSFQNNGVPNSFTKSLFTQITTMNDFFRSPPRPHSSTTGSGG